jgi:hypothetical protein
MVAVRRARPIYPTVARLASPEERILRAARRIRLRRDTARRSIEGVDPMESAATARVHPCLRCGACCAMYRASFYWSEAVSGGGTVPDELTERVSPFHLAMRGTNQANPRCVALEGEIGGAARCSIYPLRSSSCHEVEPSWESGRRDDRCDAARLRHGLAPLTPADWVA